MPHPLQQATIDPSGILHLPLARILRFLDQQFPDQFPLHLLLLDDLKDLYGFPTNQTPPPLHLNLSPGSPEHSGFLIEENAATLLAAIHDQIPVIPVILSGSADRALQLGLLSPAEFCQYATQLLQPQPPLRN